jgi:hypothetical protein
MTTLDPKDPDVEATYSIDWSRELVTEAKRDQDFTLGAFARPHLGTGFYYEATTAGRTAARYPRWPRSAGETVNDGSVVWTARAPSAATLPSVASATWTVPDGITLESQSEDGFFTHVTLSGGTDGESYELTCRMTDSNGVIREQSITIEVESQ